jgi:hypothetical protein
MELLRDDKRPQRIQTVVPGASIRFHQSVARVGMPAANSHGPPEVHVMREGESIQAIEIACTCGKCVRLICEY